MKSKHLKIGVVVVVIATIVFSSLIVTGRLSRTSTEEVIMEVDYFGSWEGNITQAGSSRKVSGFGKKKVTLLSSIGGSDILTIRIRKIGDDSSQLRVRLMQMNGTFLKGASTNDPFGMVEISLEPS